MCKTEAAIRTQRAGPGMKGQARPGLPLGPERRGQSSTPQGAWRTGGGQSPGPNSGKEEGAQGAPHVVPTNFSTGHCIITTEKNGNAETMKGLHWNMFLTTGLTFHLL